MSVAEKIKPITVESEFRICTVCGYDMGFHVSFQKTAKKKMKLILICPQCGARFDPGWTIDLPE